MRKFDFDDIAISPSAGTDISTRSEICITENGMLPLFVAPMDSVIDESNASVFHDQGLNITLPRNVYTANPDMFVSSGLHNVYDVIEKQKPLRLLIDIANGHMTKLHDTVHDIKSKYDIQVMVGNIANPETLLLLEECGADYVRCGIGGGSACTTSANTGIHYPLGSLISECREIKERDNLGIKIIADGGFRKFSDIIKAIYLGADYVMLGGIMNKCIEACSDSFFNGFKVSEAEGKELFSQGQAVQKMYRGMSTKEVQKKWGITDLKTSEGISFYNNVEYTLNGWVENFEHYLKTAMSYTGCKTLEEFRGGEYIFITENARKRFAK